jgi:hypothetical protein
LEALSPVLRRGGSDAVVGRRSASLSHDRATPNPGAVVRGLSAQGVSGQVGGGVLGGTTGVPGPAAWRQRTGERPGCTRRTPRWDRGPAPPSRRESRVCRLGCKLGVGGRRAGSGCDRVGGVHGCHSR